MAHIPSFEFERNSVSLPLLHQFYKTEEEKLRRGI